MDRRGVCCQIDALDCEGTCNGTFIAAYSTPPLLTCCEESVGKGGNLQCRQSIALESVKGKLIWISVVFVVEGVLVMWPIRIWIAWEFVLGIIQNIVK